MRREQGKVGMDICLGKAKDCLWQEGRQMWHIGKWQAIQVKGKPCVKM